ncbi:MAG: ATP-binding protein [Chloroflexi bacterium]|nr:ATP-binding protein [Chloroflexota bacterium]
MNTPPVSIPGYAPETFVNREAEIERVRQAIRVIRAGNGDTRGLSAEGKEGAPIRRTIIFQGIRGAGKTWLALHIKRFIAKEFQEATAVLVRLDPRLDGLFEIVPGWERECVANPGRKEAAAAILRWLVNELKPGADADASEADLANWLAQRVAGRFESPKVFVLVVDSVYEADWNLLESLEHLVLGPLAQIKRTLIVMTGRGKPYPWESPYLRVNAHFMDLQPFDEQHIALQTKAQAPESQVSPNVIKQLGGGIPLTNYLLALNPDDLNGALENLLEFVPLGRRRRIRRYLEALCILADGFREEEMVRLLIERFKGVGEFAELYAKLMHSQQAALRVARDVRDELLQYSLVNWKEGRFRLDEALRHVTETYLKRDQPKTWIGLRQCALEVNQQWADRFPQYREFYERRAREHQLALEGASIRD